MLAGLYLMLTGCVPHGLVYGHSLSNVTASCHCQGMLPSLLALVSDGNYETQEGDTHITPC